MQPRDLDAELAPVPGLGQRDVADVELDVELRVLDPIRVIEVERHPHQSLTKRPRAAQPLANEAQDVLEPYEPARRRRGIIDAHGADVHGRVRRLQVDEGRILGGQLLHGALLGLRLGDA